MTNNGHDQRRTDPASALAYRKAVIDGTVSTQRERIFECLYNHQLPLNNRQISEITGIPINAVTARVRVMLDSGILQESHRAEDPQTGATGVRYVEPVPYVGKAVQREFAF